MQYVTTRDGSAHYTALDALSNNHSGDGAGFVPAQLPIFTEEMLRTIQNNRFSSTVADVLNALFSVSVSSWDVDFSIGRSVSKMFALNRRILIAELWHNPERNACAIIRNLHDMLCKKAGITCEQTNWSSIAIRIAIFAGLYGQLIQNDYIKCNERFDVSVHDEDLADVMAAWYARKMGLPIGNILCTCRDDKTLWNMIHLGECSIGSNDPLFSNIERLVSGTLGQNEANAFMQSISNSNTYTVPKDQLSCLNDGIFVAVVGKDRGESVARSIRSINQYAISLEGALCYGAIQDHRSRTGESRPALLIEKEKF